MRNLIALLQIAGLLLIWALFSLMLVPCAIAVWALKYLVRGLEWLRDKSIGEA